MEAIARLFVNVIDLAEAEGRSLRRELVRGIVTVALAISTVILLMLGITFLVWGVYGSLARALGTEAAAFITGAAWIGASLIVARVV